MFIINSLLNDADEKRIIKRATFWNMCASLLNALISAILLFFITRLCGVNEAGIFSIASAIAYQCISLGNFGTRGLQAADIQKEFLFSDYFYLRIFSYSLMMLLLLYYSFCSGYTFEKAIAVFLFGVFKSVDVIEDLYHGEYHRANRLDIASILLTFRYLVSLTLFVGCIFITRNLSLSSFILSIITFLIFIFSNKKLITHFYHGKYQFRFNKFKSLLLILIPIVITNFIKLYITNSPKYAIDSIMNDASQTYFNVLFMPVFVISLIADIIFRPYIPIFSKAWSNNLKEFRSMLVRQCLIIIGLTLLVMIGGYILGLTLLELIYGINLHNDMLSFMVLLLGGGFSTFCSFFILVLTIQRQQKIMMLINVLMYIFCLLFSNVFVSFYGIFGASILYVVLNLLPAVLFFFLIVYQYKKKQRSGCN